VETGQTLKENTVEEKIKEAILNIAENAKNSDNAGTECRAHAVLHLANSLLVIQTYNSRVNT